jgi:hypothetical protein
MATSRSETPAAVGTGGARRSNMPIGTRFAAAPSYDAGARTVELVAATETPVRMPGWLLGIDADHYLEVLDCRAEAVDLTQVEAGNAPMLDTHGRWALDDRLGQVKSVRFEPGKVISLCAFGQSEKARAQEAEFAAGTPPKPSVGYKREQMIFERMEGDLPVYRVTRWSFVEVSLCPIAADPNAGVRSDVPTISPCTIQERHMADEATGAAAPTNNDDNDATTAAAAAAGTEGERSANSRKRRFCALSGSSAVALLTEARSFGESVETRAKELIEKNEKDEISVDAIRAGILSAAGEAQRAQTGGISTGGRSIGMGEGDREKFLKGATNAILMRAGLTEVVTRAAKLRGETIDLDPGEFRGVRNAELARMVIERAGERVTSHDRDEIVSQAILLRMDGPYQAQSDFTVLMENVMNKSLQAAYAIQPDTWRNWAGVGSVSDFRDHHRYLRGTFGRLQKVLENGEIKNLQIPDGSKESISAEEFGGIVGLTRKAIVNDDLGVFNQISQDLGRAAKLSVEVDAYATLTANGGLGPIMNDGKTLFHADHGNIVTPAAAPSIASFEAMDLSMAAQKDVSGNEFLDIALYAFLGPRAMRGEALIINDSQFDTETAGKFQRPNKVRGLFTTITGTPRLTGTRYYGFADPAVMPAIEIVFLNGEQEPRVEQKDGWRVSGVEWRVLFDYGVGGVNYRAAQTNAGA